MSCLNIEKVSCHYNGRPVLEQLSLQVADNEIVCLLGASGCGKTTLLKAVAGLLPLAQGEIRLGETLLDAPGVSVPPEARHIGMIFQDYALFPHLTVAENVGFGLTGQDRGSRQQQVEEALALVNLQGLGERYPHQLSGGQQQRVAIARALASSPQIILFDEPTSALDPEMIGEVLQVMKTLAHSGITMLVVTHEMQFAREIADRVVFIDGGDILEVAPPAEFFAHPQHARARRFLQKVLDPLHQESLE